MMNMQNMMKQAQKLQKEMQEKQAELSAMTFTGKSAQDLVIAELSANKKLISLSINKDIIDPNDPEMLQDMVVTAINNGLEQIDEAIKQKMGKFAEGLPF